MGQRGPAPRRDDERRRRNVPEGGFAEQIGQTELNALPFEVDLSPEPPEAPEYWEPVAKEFWAALKRDPARKWMTAADWAMARFVAESMHRDLAPQVVSVTEDGGVVKERVPIKGANLSSYLKSFSMLGITEDARLRLRKEITLFPQDPPKLASVESIVEDREEEVQ